MGISQAAYDIYQTAGKSIGNPTLAKSELRGFSETCVVIRNVRNAEMFGLHIQKAETRCQRHMYSSGVQTKTVCHTLSSQSH